MARATAVFAITAFLTFAATGEAWAYGRAYLPGRVEKGGPATLGPGIPFKQHVALQRKELQAEGFKLWTWQSSDCRDCEIAILPVNDMVNNELVLAYLRTLEEEKATILNLYRSNAQEYNLLAHMAVGILGRESRFFQSGRYWAKENYQEGVDFLKALAAFFMGRPVYQNSRGPTQIKLVPGVIDTIVNHYRIEPDTLGVPKNAAVATVGYLVEALREMKTRIASKQWSQITPETYVDYLPYIYFGGKGQLTKGTATPEINIYVKDMKKYMGFVELYEKPRR